MDPTPSLFPVPEAKRLLGLDVDAELRDEHGQSWAFLRGRFSSTEAGGRETGAISYSVRCLSLSWLNSSWGTVRASVG